LQDRHRDGQRLKHLRTRTRTGTLVRRRRSVYHLGQQHRSLDQAMELHTKSTLVGRSSEYLRNRPYCHSLSVSVLFHLRTIAMLVGPDATSFFCCWTELNWPARLSLMRYMNDTLLSLGLLFFTHTHSTFAFLFFNLGIILLLPRRNCVRIASLLRGPRRLART